MKAMSAMLAMGLIIALTAGAVSGSDDDKEHKHRERYESKIYGTIEKLPQGLVGTWIVNGREILVTSDTLIEEDHGKAETGAYVEVKGGHEGKRFSAYKIEVKKARK
ncbi:MAG: hypothetical protein HY808_03875 [Nitrospirae bacterium]|nr:hypothetical protein [Nitrospirota bacterium]